MLELRARLVEADDLSAARSQELGGKTEEVVAAKARVSELEKNTQEVESELLSLREVSAATAAELSSTLAKTSELQCSVVKLSELQTVAAALEGEKERLQETVETMTGQAEDTQSKWGQMEVVIRSLQEEKNHARESLQQADECRAALEAQMAEIASLVG